MTVTMVAKKILFLLFLHYTQITEAKLGSPASYRRLDVCHPRNMTLSVNLQMRYPGDEVVPCEDNGIISQDLTIGSFIRTALNNNFAESVPDWNGEANFQNFRFAQDEADTSQSNRLRVKRINQYLIKEPCPEVEFDCEADAYCRRGCLTVMTTMCGPSRFADWQNLAGDIEDSLRKLDFDCLGTVEELGADVSVGLPLPTPTQPPTISPATPLPSISITEMPTNEPTLMPVTRSPSTSPSQVPSSSPTSATPSAPPSQIQTNDPTFSPVTATPSNSPSQYPSKTPSRIPSVDPTSPPVTTVPSASPSRALSFTPTAYLTEASLSEAPSLAPSSEATSFPVTSSPSRRQSEMPSGDPTANPSASPSVLQSQGATSEPTAVTNPPSRMQSFSPSTDATDSPGTFAPSETPTTIVTASPTGTLDTNAPSAMTSFPASIEPTSNPSSYLSGEPTRILTTEPTVSAVTAAPTTGLSLTPSIELTSNLSFEPTSPLNEAPTSAPTVSPVTAAPSEGSSIEASIELTSNPSSELTAAPSETITTAPTNFPVTAAPSEGLSAQLSTEITSNPSFEFTAAPSEIQLIAPTSEPTDSPLTVAPSEISSIEASIELTSDPSFEVTAPPSETITTAPTNLPVTTAPSEGLSAQLSTEITSTPSFEFTVTPSEIQLIAPTSGPTDSPLTVAPSEGSTAQVSTELTSNPSFEVTAPPSETITMELTGSLTTAPPSNGPTFISTASLSTEPSEAPTIGLTSSPTSFPSNIPSQTPTMEPTIATAAPTFGSEPPSIQPTSAPTLAPTQSPSVGPTTSPATITPTVERDFTCLDNPQDVGMNIDLQLYFVRDVVTTCTTEEEDTIKATIQAAVNNNFDTSVPSWDGDAFFGPVSFDPSQTAGPGSVRQRRLQSGACPERDILCEGSLCKWGCVTAATTDCGTSAFTEWINLESVVKDSLLGLGLTCLGISDQMEVILVVQDPDAENPGGFSRKNNFAVEADTGGLRLQDGRHEVVAHNASKALKIRTTFTFSFFDGEGAQPDTSEVVMAEQEIIRFFSKKFQSNGKFHNVFHEMQLSEVVPSYDAETDPDMFVLQFMATILVDEGARVHSRDVLNLMSAVNYRELIHSYIRGQGGLFDNVFKILFRGVGRAGQ